MWNFARSFFRSDLRDSKAVRKVTWKVCYHDFSQVSADLIEYYLREEERVILLWHLCMCVCMAMLLSVSSVQSSRSVLPNSLPMDCCTPGFPVHYQLPELAQTHVHRVSDAIQPSHSLSSPSNPTFNLSQHQSLFKWVSSSHQVAKVSVSF